MKRKLRPFITVILFLSTYARAQFTINKQVKPYFGHSAIKKKVSDLKANTVAATITGKQLDSTAVKSYISYFKRFKNLDRTGKSATSPAQEQEPKNGNGGQSLLSAIPSSNFVISGPAQ